MRALGCSDVGAGSGPPESPACIRHEHAKRRRTNDAKPARTRPEEREASMAAGRLALKARVFLQGSSA